MTVQVTNGVLFTGLSSDVKPTATTVAAGALFVETDTSKVYVNSGTAWIDTVLNTRQTYSTYPQTDPAAQTSATFVCAGLSNGPGSTTLNMSSGSAVGATSIVVTANTNFFQGENILIDGASANAEYATIASIASTTFTLKNPLTKAHANSVNVVGSYIAIQPKSTGRLEISATGFLLGVNGATVNAQLIIGSAITAAPPAANAAVPASAVAVGNIAAYVALTGALQAPFQCAAALGCDSATDTAPSGGAARTVGTPYYIDLSFKASSGASQVKGLSLFVQEF